LASSCFAAGCFASKWRLAGELPAMILRRYGIDKGQGQGIGKIG
jgi:hypothetical protein